MTRSDSSLSKHITQTIHFLAGVVLALMFTVIGVRCGGDRSSGGSTPSQAQTAPARRTPPPSAQVAPVEQPTPAPAQPVTARVPEPAPPAEPTPSVPTAAVISEPEAVNGAPETVHRTRRGDTLWDLAEHYYGDGLLWPNIYRANPAIGSNPDYLITGVNIAIPSLEGSPGNLTAADASNLYQGYLAAHRAFQARGDERADIFLRWSEKYQ